MRIIFVISIIIGLSWAITYLIKLLLDTRDSDKQMKQAAEKQKLSEILRFKDVHRKHNRYNLSDKQEALIRRWLEVGWAPEHHVRFKTIIQEYKYSLEDKEILSKERIDYIKFKKEFKKSHGIQR